MSLRISTHQPKALLVKVLQWFYLILALLAASGPFVYNAYFSQLGFPQSLVVGLAGVGLIYCLLLAVSFFTQNSSLLILSLVFIFFTTLGSLALIAIAFPNASAVVTGHLPKCYTALETCSLRDGVVVSSAFFLTIAVPTLLINILTIIGAVKAIAAND